MEKKIYEFYDKYDSLITSKPNLIIDVRNNGGGSDGCVVPLLEYIYTKPFYQDTVEVYATKGNIKRYEEFYETRIKNDTINYDNDYRKSFTDEIEKMKTVPNKTFIPRAMGELIKGDTILKYPSKVAIIINKGCASSCETLLFWAKESDKTILVGENSGGFVGYGEVTETETPNFKFILRCTMTRYRQQRKYEATGVIPNFYLSLQKDWIEQALELLKK